MATILLFGATGNVTGATIRALQGSGHKLVGLVRDAAKAKPLEALGVELKVGDLEKLRTVENAFEGIDTAFLCTNPGFHAPVLQSNALWAARRGGAKHIVRLSAVGAAHDAPSLNSRLHALSDSETIGSGLKWTILKPHFFMQNLMMSVRGVKDSGTFVSALGDAKVPMIDVRDIGLAAAKVLSNPAPHAGKTYTLTGAPVSMQDVAKALGEVAGKPVKYMPIPVAAMIDNMAKMGADEYGQVSLRDYFTNYSQGWQSTPTGTFKELTGQEPRTIAGFANELSGMLK
ncbi:MAG: SDR family oxidoreductase [Myxococcaceae bacterium]